MIGHFLHNTFSSIYYILFPKPQFVHEICLKKHSGIDWRDERFP